MFLGRRVATRRRARGLRRDELGALLGSGRTASVVAAYETGVADPSAVIVLDLADALRCDSAALFDSEADPLLLAARRLDHHIRTETARAPIPSGAAVEQLRHLLPPVPVPERRTATA